MLSHYNSKFVESFYGFEIDLVEFVDTLKSISEISDDEIKTLVQARAPSPIAIENDLVKNIIANKKVCMQYLQKVKDLTTNLEITVEELGSRLSIKQIGQDNAEAIYKLAKDNDICLKYITHLSSKFDPTLHDSSIQKAKLFNEYCRETKSKLTEIPASWWNDAYNTEKHKFILDVLKRNEVKPMELYECAFQAPFEIVSAIYDMKIPQNTIDKLVKTREEFRKSLEKLFKSAKKCTSFVEVDTIQGDVPVVNHAWDNIKQIFKESENLKVPFEKLHDNTYKYPAESVMKMLNLIVSNGLSYDLLMPRCLDDTNMAVIGIDALLKDGFVVCEPSIHQYDAELAQSLKSICLAKNIDRADIPWNIDLDIDFDDAEEVDGLVEKMGIAKELAEKCSISVNEISPRILNKAQAHFDSMKEVINLLTKHQCPLSKLKAHHIKWIPDDMKSFEYWMDDDYPLAGDSANTLEE